MALPNASNSSNFNVVPNPDCQPGDTLANLKSAVMGETGASAKYAAYSKKAAEEGFGQIASLFAAASKAEQIHIAMESNLVRKAEPDYVNPEAPEAEVHSTDVNLIDAALGEIFETSDMYPQFIKIAQEAGDTAAEMVFTRAKLAEAYHAQRYIDAYNTIDHLTDEKYYVCPGCGYIHKGKGVGSCPICGAPESKFLEF